MAKPDFSWLNTKGHVAIARQRAAADAAERKQAEKAPGTIILTKEDVRGDYDASRVLMTTLGGAHRALTAEDLATFRRNMRTVQSRLTGSGITAKQVLDLAHTSPLTSPEGGNDLARANQQIRMAVPASATVKAAAGTKALDVRFVTNAGPDSRVSSHNVLVRFHAFGEAVRALQSRPSIGTDKGAPAPRQMALKMRAAYLGFECDCERHRYFFRYLATAGGFNAGRDELGYPKIRNPGLKGVACKHVLRVMAEVNSSTAVLRFLTGALEKSMRSPTNTATIQTTQKEARTMAAKQVTRSRDLEKLAEKVAATLKNPPPTKLRANASRRTSGILKKGRVEEALALVPFLSASEKARLVAALTKGTP